MTKRVLHVSEDASLPLDMLSDSTTIFGRKRVGKSNNGAVIVEEALDLHAQVVGFDPKGDWWGITSSFDGKAEGYPVVVIGGSHGTPGVALNPFAGTATADWVLETGYSVVFDLSQLKPSEINRFVSDFLERLRRRKVEKPGPILLFFDEADELAPEDQRDRIHVIDCYRMVVWCVKRGGFAGIGTLAITQRPASLSKNVTTQSETVIVMHVSGSTDLDAVSEALKHHVPGATKKERAAGLEDLQREIVTLGKGETVIVSAVPELKGTIHRIAFRRRKTFDSGATPKFGEVQRAPKVVATVALERLSEAMTRAAEEVKASDPALLKQEVARLRAELAKRPEAKPAPPVVKEVSVLKPKDRSLILRLVKAAESLVSESMNYKQNIESWLLDTRPVVAALTAVMGDGSSRQEAGRTTPAPVTAVRTPPRVQSVPASPAVTRRSDSGTAIEGRSHRRPPSTTHDAAQVAAARTDIAPSDQRVLNALATLETLSVYVATRAQVALWSRYTVTGGRFGNLLGSLRTRGLLDYPTPDGVALTDEGRAAAVADPIRDQFDLHERIFGVVDPSERRIVQALFDVYPDATTREELAERAQFTASGGRFGNILGKLRSLGIADYPAKGTVRATDICFFGRAA